MALYEITMFIEIDEEELALHDGDQKPPPNDIEEWDARDVFDAADLGIVNPSESELRYIEGPVSNDN